MKQIRDYEQVAKTICEAYRDALMAPWLQFAVVLDGETGLAYETQGIAGENNMPVRVWRGRDQIIVQFCFQGFRIGDDDPEYVAHVLEYAKMPDMDVTAREVQELFPGAVKMYEKEWIENEMSDFCPFVFIELFEEINK